MSSIKRIRSGSTRGGRRDRAVEIDNRGIPPLAGICSYEEAARAGLSVEGSVERLKRYNYVLGRLHEVSAAHLPSTPEWEVKCALSLHLWLDAEHAGAIRRRVAELRQPPLGLDAVPDARLEAAFEEIMRSRGTVELVAACVEARRAPVAAGQEELPALHPPLLPPPPRGPPGGPLPPGEGPPGGGAARLG